MWRDKIVTLTNNHGLQLLGCAVTSSLCGALVGYRVAAKKLENKYALIADQEIAEVKRHYAILNKTGEYSDPASLAAKYVEKVDDLGYSPSDEIASPDDIAAELERRAVEEHEAEEDPGFVVVSPEEIETIQIQHSNVFESEDPETFFNMDEELRRREEKPDEPYVITRQEFDESDANTTTLTYFDGDDVLADEQDKPCDIADTVGHANLLRFGHGSGDKRVVYIRNEKLDLDIEVIKDDDSFSEKVLGFIQHSDSRRPRRFRQDD